MKLALPILFLLGLLVGVFCAIAMTNAINARNAWPRATMVLISKQHQLYKKALFHQRCNSDTLSSARVLLPALAREIAPSNVNLGQNPEFVRLSKKMVLTSDVLAASRDCDSMSKAMREVNDLCQTCHQIFR